MQLDSSNTNLEAHIDTAVENVHTFLANHLDEDDEIRFRNAKLTA